MIGKFVSSRFSGYIAIAAVVAVLGMVFYIYNEGKKSCISAAINEQLESNIDSAKGAREVRKIERRLATPELNKGLCRLEIARGNRGCT